MLVYVHNRSSLNTIPTTHPKVRVHVYKINLLLDAIKYLSTGSPKRGVVQRVRHSLRRTLLLAVETLFLQALSSRSFLFGTRAGMAPSRRVCSAILCVPWWFATSEWCMTDYWENANWKPISLKPLGMKACGTSDDGSAGWTASRTFETEEELHVLPCVSHWSRRFSCICSYFLAFMSLLPRGKLMLGDKQRIALVYIKDDLMPVLRYSI